MATRCPFANWRPIAANHTVGGRQPIRGFVPHVQVGTGSLWGFFNTPKPPGAGASSDFWCSKTGVLEQYVDLADQAWAQGSTTHNGNPDFVSCEFEGVPGEPMTPEQIAMGGRLIAWIETDVNDFPLQVNLDPDNGEGITPHHVFGGGHTCPGPGPREGQFPDLIAAAQQILNPAPQPQPEDDMPHRRFVIEKGGKGTVYLVDVGITEGGVAVPAEKFMGTFRSFVQQGGVIEPPPPNSETVKVAGVDVWIIAPDEFHAMFPALP